VEAAVVCLQRWFRGHLARKHVLQLRIAAMTVQSAVLRFAARKRKTSGMRVLAAAVRLQSWWRMLLAKKEAATRRQRRKYERLMGPPIVGARPLPAAPISVGGALRRVNVPSGPASPQGRSPRSSRFIR